MNGPEIPDDRARVAGPGELESDELTMDDCSSVGRATGRDVRRPAGVGSVVPVCRGFDPRQSSFPDTAEPDISDAPFESFERRDRLNDREWEEGK